MEGNRGDFDILNKMKRLSRGLVIIPLVLAAIIATFFPQAFQIGGYITALFYNGSSAIVGLFLIVCGSAIDIHQVGMPLHGGITLTGIKLLLRVAVGLLAGELYRPASILGLAPLVLIAAITNSNGSLYISLSSQFGSATDTGAISILSLSDGPFFTLMALGITGLASAPFGALVATLVPLLIGLIWGNMDKGFRSVYATAQPIVTLFVAISIDSRIDVSTLVTAGASSIVLGLISTTTAVVFFFVLNLLLSRKKRNATGAAVGTTALNSVMTPTAVAQVNPSMGPYMDMATARCTTAPIITLFLCPFVTAFFDGWMRKNKRGVYSPEGWATGEA